MRSAPTHQDVHARRPSVSGPSDRLAGEGHPSRPLSDDGVVPDAAIRAFGHDRGHGRGTSRCGPWLDRPRGPRTPRPPSPLVPVRVRDTRGGGEPPRPPASPAGFPYQFRRSSGATGRSFVTADGPNIRGGLVFVLSSTRGTPVDSTHVNRGHHVGANRRYVLRPRRGHGPAICASPVIGVRSCPASARTWASLRRDACAQPPCRS